MDIFKRKPVNPFYDTINIPDEYFCDRKKETSDLIGKIKNGPNVVLVAERRVGKTSLLFHLFKSKEIRRQYNTVYVDVYNTKSPEDFINTFKQGLLDSDFSNSETLQIKEITKEFSGKIGMNLPPFSVEATARTQKTINVENTLGQLFEFLDRTTRPNLIVFDEFQEIEKYEEKITPQLRSFIQRLNNTRFIYSGSSAHQLTAMFTEHNKAFYKSSTLYGLDKIPMEAYSEFCQTTFAKYGKKIEPDAINLVYYLFKGITLDMQLMMKKVFEQAARDMVVDTDFVKSCVAMLLDEQDRGFSAKIHALEGKMQRNVLMAVSAEGVAENITSSAMIARYDLSTASHVQNAIKKLTGEDNLFLVKIAKGTYVLDNKFLELWIARKMGILEQKFDYAKALFDKEQEISERQVSFQIKHPETMPFSLQDRK